MASIAFDPVRRARSATGIGALGLPHRLVVLLRASRLARRRRRRVRLALDECRDPHLAEDIGVDPRRHRRHDWIGEMVRALGGSGPR